MHETTSQILSLDPDVFQKGILEIYLMVKSECDKPTKEQIYVLGVIEVFAFAGD